MSDNTPIAIWRLIVIIQRTLTSKLVLLYIFKLYSVLSITTLVSTGI